MQRAARLLSKFRLRDARLAPESLGEALWPTAVGKRLAARTGPVRQYGKKVVVTVDDPVWQDQLTTLAPQILSKLQRMAGPGAIDGLEFRVGPRKQGPHVALPSAPADDRADGVADPIFRQLYLASRARSEKEEQRRMRFTA